MGIITFLADIMREILLWFAGITNSSGMGIIALTLAIRFALYPLTLKQTKSMVAMRELQPKMKELQAKYKDKPQEYQKRVMELYKENKVNPLGGCLPVLVQMPFLMSLFWVLNDFPAALDPQFLLWNLGEPAGQPLFILPLLAAGTTYVQMMMAMTDPSQKALMMIMPVFIGWLSINFPAGLVVYWVVSNVFSIGQQHLINQQMAAEQGGTSGK